MAVLSVRAGSVADTKVGRLSSLSSADSNSALKLPSTPASSATSSSRDSALSKQGRPTGGSTAVASPATPEKLGRFAILKKIGQGGFGEVWLAEDTLLKRQVALKLPRFAPSDTKRQRRFLAESRTAALLRHPHIVPVLDAGVIDGKHFIASEFIRGVPLDDIHDHRPASVRWTVETLAKLARATEVAHQQQVIHRDLKPDNVLIDRRGEPQILDFGLAKRLDDEQSQTMDGTVMGSPHFMSPEQARGEVSKVGPASDQFSLGVILYRLLTGQTPHTGQPLAVLQKLIDNPTPSLANVEKDFPVDLIAICDKARAAEIGERYPSCETLAEDLERFLAGLPVAARPPSPLTRAGKWVRNHPREASLATACIASGLLLFTVSVWGWAQAAQAAAQAAITEEGLRSETARLLQLEERLSERVEEAAALRDETAAARQATIAAREALETESETLDQQTRLAEASLAKLRETETGLSDAEAKRQQAEASLSDVAQAADSSLSTVRRIAPEQKNNVVNNAAFTSEELALTKDNPLRLLCKTGETAFLVKPDGKFRLEKKLQQPNTLGIAEIAFGSNQQMFGVLRNDQILDGAEMAQGTTDSNGNFNYGIAKLTSAQRWVSAVPLQTKEVDGLTRYQYEQALEQGFVTRTRRRRQLAVDQRNRIYFTTNRYESRGDKHSDCVRYDPANESFKHICRLFAADIHAYPDDPEAIYLFGEGFVKRWHPSDGEGETATVTCVLGVMNEVFGEPLQAIRLSDQRWLVHFQKKFETSRTHTQVLLDLQTKTYRESKMKIRETRDNVGQWVIKSPTEWIYVNDVNVTVYDVQEDF